MSMSRGTQSSLFAKLSRRKIVSTKESQSELRRVLTTFDLTFLGVGSTIGVGVYVLAGSVARNSAGPAVLLSFLVAAVASILAGLCYAEFGARVPKAGSAYIYTYVCVGELIAFIVGWNLIMEYVIGVASVAKGFSTHLDALVYGQMQEAFRSYLPISHTAGHLAPYFDPFAFCVTMVITCILAFGVKESSIFNNIFTGIKLMVVIFIIVSGSVFSNPSNWNINPASVNMSALALQQYPKKIGPIGDGGFVPFGIGGVMRGAATCFYAYVGFDGISTASEETKNPQRAIPISLFLCLLFVSISYAGISIVLTMMVPYYLEDQEAPIPEAFVFVGFEFGKWIASIGALVGFSASLLGVMFPMPRVIYAMASDGLLFAFLAKIHPKTQTPLLATLLAGTLGAIMAGVFDLDALVDMMSVGTLTAYTFVAIGVLLLRYRREAENCPDLEPSCDRWWRKIFSQCVNSMNSTTPTVFSSFFSGWAISIYSLLIVVICVLVTHGSEELWNLSPSYLTATSLVGLVLVFLLISLSFQPVAATDLTFMVPGVPLLPGLSILFNVYLICQLSGSTWIRFGVWLFIGMLIYLYCLFSGASDKAYEKQIDVSEGTKTSKNTCKGGNIPLNCTSASLS